MLGDWRKFGVGCQVWRFYPLGEDNLPNLARGQSEGAPCGAPRRLGVGAPAQQVRYKLLLSSCNLGRW